MTVWKCVSPAHLCCVVADREQTAFDPLIVLIQAPEEKRAKGAPAIQRRAGLVSSFLSEAQTGQLPFEVSFTAGTKGRERLLMFLPHPPFIGSPEFACLTFSNTNTGGGGGSAAAVFAFFVFLCSRARPPGERAVHVGHLYRLLCLCAVDILTVAEGLCRILGGGETKNKRFASDGFFHTQSSQTVTQTRWRSSTSCGRFPPCSV